jgi:hypothetical protein
VSCIAMYVVACSIEAVRSLPCASVSEVIGGSRTEGGRRSQLTRV